MGDNRSISKFSCFAKLENRDESAISHRIFLTLQTEVRTTQAGLKPTSYHVNKI